MEQLASGLRFGCTAQDLWSLVFASFERMRVADPSFLDRQHIESEGYQAYRARYKPNASQHERNSGRQRRYTIHTGVVL